MCLGNSIINRMDKLLYSKIATTEEIKNLGWNYVEERNKSKYIGDINSSQRFYFTHSFNARCKFDEDIIGITNYGYNFCSIVEKDNIVGTQFHPEKSGFKGFKLINNFLNGVA